MICSKCGNEVAEGKKFCGHCGNPMTGSEAKGLVCSKCGAPITPGKKFCGKCGSPVSADSQAAAKAACTVLNIDARES